MNNPDKEIYRERIAHGERSEEMLVVMDFSPSVLLHKVCLDLLFMPELRTIRRRHPSLVLCLSSLLIAKETSSFPASPQGVLY